MPLGVELLVERIFQGAGRVVGDDGFRAFGGDCLAEPVAIVGRIGHDDFGGKLLDQSIGLWCIAFLTGGKHEAYGASETAYRQMDFGAQAAARTTKGLIFSPFFAPEACW